MRPVASGRWTLPTVLSTALLVAGLMMPAAAETVTVSADIKEPARNLELLDLAGQPLTELSLRDGLASAFETRVTDTNQDPQGSYRVDATMTNLHRVTDTGHSAEDQIPSSAVDLDFARSPRVAEPLVDLRPTGTLSSTQAITCDAVATTLSLTGTLLDLTSSDPICGLLDDLFTTLSLSDGVHVTGATLDNVLVETVDLSDLAIDALPLVARTGDPGTFTNPNCASGIGAPFCEGTSPTVLQTLRNDAAGTIDAQLRSHLEAQLPAAGEIVTEIVQALQASGADLTDGGGSVVGTVSDLGDALGEYDDADQLALVQEFIDIAWDQPELADLAHLSGRTSTRPTLMVDTSNAAGGHYEGTLTVTLIE